MEEVIYKLKALQSIEPDQAWQTDKKRKLMEKISVFGVKNDIFLNANDIYIKKPVFNWRSLVPNHFAVSFASFCLLLTSGIFTVSASQSSLPGDTLYSVKKATEQIELAVASDQDKPKVEIEQAGKRLEELAQISQRASDAHQHEKVQQLVVEFNEKVNSANTHLSALSGSNNADNAKKEKVASVAKVVNEQSEKYTDVLQKTTDSLPISVKEKVAGKVADATKTTEKVNLSALMVMVDNAPEQNKGEVVAKVQETVAKTEAKVNEITAANTEQTPVVSPNNADQSGNTCSNGTDSATVKDNSTENVAITEEAKKELEKAKENLKNNNLIDTLKSVVAANEIADTVTTASNSASAPAGAETQPVTDASVNGQ